MLAPLPGLLDQNSGMRNLPPPVSTILYRAVRDMGGEIALVPDRTAPAVLVLIQLGRIEGLGEQTFEENRVGESVGMQIDHGAQQRPMAEDFVALED